VFVNSLMRLADEAFMLERSHAQRSRLKPIFSIDCDFYSNVFTLTRLTLQVSYGMLFWSRSALDAVMVIIRGETIAAYLGVRINFARSTKSANRCSYKVPKILRTRKITLYGGSNQNENKGQA